MSRTGIQTTDLQACIHTDGRRQDGRTIGQTNERKENIQTDRLTNNKVVCCRGEVLRCSDEIFKFSDEILSCYHNFIMLFEQDDKLCKQDIKLFELHIKLSERVKNTTRMLRSIRSYFFIGKISSNILWFDKKLL